MNKRLAWYAWGVLAYNILVVLWGAYVRASGSGAGCGSHWPLCNGEVLPRTQTAATAIELLHRVTSGGALALVVGLAVWSFRSYPRGHHVRKGVGAALVLIGVEALIGAALVRFDLVADTVSWARAAVLAVHLLNTFLLIGTLTLVGWWTSGGAALRLRRQGLIGGALFVALAGVLLLGMSGAVTALGDTLFPSASLADGFARDFATTSHALLRLRFVHPLLAISTSLYLVSVAAFVRHTCSTPTIRRFAWTLVALLVLQGAAGGLTVLLLAPIWAQLLHLFLADALWVTLVLFTAATLDERIPYIASVPARSIPSSATSRPTVAR